MKERARAIIMLDGHVILMKRTKPLETFYVFPGGGLEKDEMPEAAVVREVKEEAGLHVEVQGLFKKEIWHDANGGQQMQYFYLCKATGGTVGTGDGPEYQEGGGYEGITEIVSVALAGLKKLDCRPASIRDLVVEKSKTP